MASFKAGSTTRRPIATDLGLASFRIHAKLLIPLNPHPYAHKPRVGDPVGEMSEWLKEHAWKACVGETLPWVRIPLSPPNFAALVWRFEWSSRHQAMRVRASLFGTNPTLSAIAIVGAQSRRMYRTARALGLERLSPGVNNCEQFDVPANPRMFAARYTSRILGNAERVATVPQPPAANV